MTLHQGLERSWATSSLSFQLGNLASELARARRQAMRGEQEQRNTSLDRAHELLWMTINDHRWKSQWRELTRLKEVLNDQYQNSREYHVSLDWLIDYCTSFACVARRMGG